MFNSYVDKSQVTLKAENNKLEFYYIENNLNIDGTDILGTFTYMPQKSYGEARIIGFIAGQQLSLHINMLGRVNHYQWQFSDDNGQTWSSIGTNDPELVIDNVAESDEGQYRVKITNDRANKPGDEIISAIKTVRIEQAPVIINWPVN